MKISNYLVVSRKIELNISIFLHIKFCFPCRLNLYIYYIKQFWYFRGSDDTLTVTKPILERQGKESDNEESDNDSSDGIVPPTVNHPVQLRMHNRWPNVFTVADMIRTWVLHKLRKEQFLRDGEESSLLASLFDECVKYTLKVSH